MVNGPEKVKHAYALEVIRKTECAFVISRKKISNANGSKNKCEYL